MCNQHEVSVSMALNQLALIHYNYGLELKCGVTTEEPSTVWNSIMLLFILALVYHNMVLLKIYIVIPDFVHYSYKYGRIMVSTEVHTWCLILIWK